MAEKVADMKRDIEELTLLLNQCSRRKNRDLLEIQIRKLQTELSKLVEAAKSTETPSKTNNIINTGIKCYEVKLSNYCWDQSEKYMKIYVSLNNVQTLPSEATNCIFAERSIDLKVMGLDNKNYHLPICNLCEEIDPTQSYIKVKKNTIIIFLHKKVPKEWSHVTKIEKTIKESKAPKLDSGDSADPESGLMNLMKKMYQEGDDEMKKTIAKAWTENQEKQSAGLL